MGGIGSSDIAAILGISPWKTAFQVYQEKLGLNEAIKNSYVMERGTRYEPKARALFELKIGRSFSAALVEMKEYPFMLASLDGRDEEQKELVEFKYVGKDKGSIVPDYYMCQIQQALMISNFKSCHYQPYDIVDKEVVLHQTILVASDIEQQKVILKAGINFWTNHVMKKVPPPFQDKDYVPLNNNDLSEKLKRWRQVKSQIETLETEQKEIETFAKSFVTEPRMKCGDVKFTRVTRIGNVNYSKIPELQGVDLNKYRGASVDYVKMLLLMIILLSGCSSVKCGDKGSSASLVTGAIVAGLQCQDGAEEVKKDMERYFASVNMCDGKAKGILSPIACPFIVDQIVKAGAGALPANWKCKPVNAKNLASAVLMPLCRSLPF